MRTILMGARLMVEPSGAVTTAAWLFHRHELPASAQTVAVISGGNAEPDLLREVLEAKLTGKRGSHEDANPDHSRYC
jgi:threonine dehydratase